MKERISTCHCRYRTGVRQARHTTLQHQLPQHKTSLRNERWLEALTSVNALLQHMPRPLLHNITPGLTAAGWARATTAACCYTLPIFYQLSSTLARSYSCIPRQCHDSLLLLSQYTLKAPARVTRSKANGDINGGPKALTAAHKLAPKLEQSVDQFGPDDPTLLHPADTFTHAEAHDRHLCCVLCPLRAAPSAESLALPRPSLR